MFLQQKNKNIKKKLLTIKKRKIGIYNPDYK